MKSDDILINKAFRSMLLVSVLATVAALLTVTVDSVITGQFLGADAVAATGLLSPVTMLFGMFGTVLGAGLGLTCVQYMGMADLKKVNGTFSAAVLLAVSASAVLALAMFFLAPVLGRLAGASGENAALLPLITDYLRGYAPCLPGLYLTMVLSSVMAADSDQMRALAGMCVTFLADLVLDLLNVLVFHGGMFGMAVASTLSQYAAVAVLLLHFRKPGRLLRFTPRALLPGELKNVILSGLSMVISQTAVSLRRLGLNRYFLSLGGRAAVASLTISQSVFVLMAAVGMGIMTAASSAAALFYGERDRNGLTVLTRLAAKTSVKMLLITAVAAIAAAPVLARLFLSDPSLDLTEATRLIRVQAIQILLVALPYAVIGIYQGMKRLSLSYPLTVLQDGLLPLAAVVGLGSLFGLRGAELGFPAAGALSLLAVVLVARVLGGRFPRSLSDLAPLSPDFGARPEDLCEVTIHSMDEVLAASEAARQMCLRCGADRRTTLLLALFVEEMAGNVILHGFSKDDKSHTIAMRLIREDEGWTIRLRDDCRPFDPVRWLEENHPEDPLRNVGIRLVVGMAKEVQYLSVLNMNNLIIRL